jgi:hypothetical protein
VYAYVVHIDAAYAYVIQIDASIYARVRARMHARAIAIDQLINST